MIKEKIVPYGEKRNVVVEKATHQLLFVIDNKIKEGFFLIGHGLNPLPKEGEKGEIVFTKGGIKGGYWKYNSK